MTLHSDYLGDEALKRLNVLPGNRSGLQDIDEKFSKQFVLPTDSDEKVARSSKRDLYALLRANAQTDEVLGKLWMEANTVPLWLNWDQVARGQDVFYRYGGPALTGLAFQSLLGGLVSYTGVTLPWCGRY